MCQLPGDVCSVNKSAMSCWMWTCRAVRMHVCSAMYPLVWRPGEPSPIRIQYTLKYAPLGVAESECAKHQVSLLFAKATRNVPRCVNPRASESVVKRRSRGVGRIHVPACVCARLTPCVPLKACRRIRSLNLHGFVAHRNRCKRVSPVSVSKIEHVDSAMS